MVLFLFVFFIYEFYSDFVFSDQSTQESVYTHCIHNLLVGAFDGYNATVLAYGQVCQIY
jgi:hypothetical protein